jgi:hypothetical protein
MLSKPISFKVSSSDYLHKYYDNNKGALFVTRFEALTSNKPLFTKGKLKKFSFSFYLNHFKRRIVNNIEPEYLNIEELITEITRHCKSEREKLNVLISFIYNSIEYDWEGYISYVNNFFVSGHMV